MANAGRKLLDSTIRAQVNVDKYGNGLSKKVISVLKKAEKEIVSTILEIDPDAPKLTKWKKDRLLKLRKRVSQDILGPKYSEIKKMHLKELEGLATIEATRTSNAANKAVGVNIFDVTLTQENLKSIVNNTMIDGQIIGDWWNEQKANFSQTFKKQMNDAMEKVQLGLIRGEAVGELVKRVRGSIDLPGTTKKVIRDATALVRTSVMSVANETRKEIYKANEDLINGYEVVATLDRRTTPICRALDGKLYTTEFKPIDHDIAYPGGPPFHWQCRSTLVPLLKSYSELTGPNNKLSKKQLRKLDSLDKSQRASINYRKGISGKPEPVSGGLTYDGWFKQQPKDVQIDILGPGRYKLWKEKKLSMADMVSNKGKTLDLGELAKVEGVLEVVPAVKKIALKAVVEPKPVVPKVPKEWVKKVEKYQREAMTYAASNWEMKYKDYIDAVNEKIKSLVKDSGTFVRISPKSLAKVLKDERFKTQFEVGSSGGGFNIEKRFKFEKIFMGVSKELDVKKRPIYGYLSDDLRGWTQEGAEGGLFQYGEVSVKLKKNLRNRTTFTGGDSMDCTRLGDTPCMQPKLVTSPSYKAGHYTPQGYNPLDIDELTSTFYWEAQIHGGVGLQDIEEIFFFQTPLKNLKKLLDEKKVKWSVVRKEEGNK